MTPGRCHTAACLLWLVTTCQLAGQPALKRFEFSQAHMGTLFRIVVYAPDAATASRASSAAFNRIARLDDIMSDYRVGSELMSLCRRTARPPLKVSEDLFRVLARSQDLARRTGGAFDITLGPVVQLWRRARRHHELPDPERLARAKELVGYQYVRLDPTARTVQLLKKGMRLDLGGIAKGYAADEALAVLKAQGIRSALVAAGGDVAVSAPPPAKEGWRVGIAPLESPDKPPTRFLLLRDAAVSTSGDVDQYVEIAGGRYSHIVDPRTGIGLAGRSSVTVVAPDATTSDSLATAISVLGPDRGLQFAESLPGVAVLFVQETEQGTLTRGTRISAYSSPSESEPDAPAAR